MQTPKKGWDGDVFVRLSGKPYVQIDVAENSGIDALPDDAVLMQSTGLLDRKGKEIFESDILQWKSLSGKVTENYLVFWDDTIASFRVKETKKGFVDELDGDFVIIGNQYEHPSLLQ